jgi:hypothetical protein
MVSLDVPRGLDATTGAIGRPCVRAAATVTLGLPNSVRLAAPEQVGDLYVADISVPRIAYEHVGLRVGGEIFADGTVVELVP